MDRPKDEPPGWSNDALVQRGRMEKGENTVIQNIEQGTRNIESRSERRI